jgi:hypothetical protein
MGSQISKSTDEDIWAWEANFFHNRCRSMMIVMYKLSPTINEGEPAFLEIDSLGIAPFRDGLECTAPVKEPQSSRRRPITQLLEGIEQMTGKRFWRSYQRALDEDGELIPSDRRSEAVLMLQDPQAFPDRMCQSFDDDLFCSMPRRIARAGPAKVVIGCRHTSSFLQICTVTYSASAGQVDRYELEQYRAVPSLPTLN